MKALENRLRALGLEKYIESGLGDPLMNTFNRKYLNNELTAQQFDALVGWEVHLQMKAMHNIAMQSAGISENDE